MSSLNDDTKSTISVEDASRVNQIAQVAGRGIYVANIPGLTPPDAITNSQLLVGQDFVFGESSANAIGVRDSIIFDDGAFTMVLFGMTPPEGVTPYGPTTHLPAVPSSPTSTTTSFDTGNERASLSGFHISTDTY